MYGISLGGTMKEKRQFGLLTVFVLLLSVVILIVTQTKALTKTQYYVKEARLENSAVLIDRLNNGERFVVMDRMSNDELDEVVNYIYDHPDLFWVDLQYHALSIGDISVIFVKDKYDDIVIKQELIDQKRDQILKSTINDSMSEYDKVLAIHDWLCDNIIYGEASNDSDQDLYGALILQKARCAGYAKAFTYLLEGAGIKSEVISGHSLNKNLERVPHAWNLVYIDGEPYYFDVTWDDDEGDGIIYDWFGLTKVDFELSHFPSSGYEWVNATATAACYYIKNDMYVEEYSPYIIAKQIRTQGSEMRIKCSSYDVAYEVLHALNSREEMDKVMTAAQMSYIGKIYYTEPTNTTCLYIKFS